MRSMTGCGYGKVQKDGWEVTAEIRSVNHRFLDISMRLPRNISFLEQTVRTCLAERINRGHVDIYLTVNNIEESALSVEADFELAALYSKIAGDICQKTGMENDLKIGDLMKMEGVITVTERDMDREKITVLCREALDMATDQLVEMREREGRNLQADLKIHLEEIVKLRLQVLDRAPLVVKEYQEKLDTRLKNLIPEGMDPQRLAQEVAIVADRCSIDEELTRLESHIQQMDSYLGQKNETGKKMDFLIQEMNRETNTIGSKASDARIAGYVVSLKSEIEKMREQIQNVE